MPPPRQASLPKANKIFVDREGPHRIFEDAAFSIPPDSAIICVFYGPGGEGKTALCRELMRKTDASVEPSYAFLRRAHLDLHGRVKTDPDLLLVWIRNEFATAGIAFPCFDFAFALAWAKARGEEALPRFVNPWLGRVSKAAQGAVGETASAGAGWLHSDSAKELLGDAIGSVPGVGFALKYLGGFVIDKTKRAYLERTYEPLQRLKKDGDLKPAYELSALLPGMLAQDFNDHLSRHPEERFVLFIDEYERVFDQGGAAARWAENPFDKHMRTLIAETNGLLAVFFSRERLPWEHHPDWRENLKGDKQHLLGGLADKDADDFLKAVPITDERIRQATIEGARETSERTTLVYPLMLDLQVEHWRELTARGEVSRDRFKIAADSFEARRIEMVERVLRDYGEALQTTIERLSVARRFDRGAFQHVVTTFVTALPLDAFDRIADLSFVTKADDGSLSFHSGIAETIRVMLTEEKRRTSIGALLQYFSSRAHVDSHFDLSPDKIAALFEAAYLRQTQGLDGYAEWLHQVTEPLRTGAFYAQATLLWREAADAVGKSLGAEHPSTATSLNNLALVLLDQGDYAAAKPLLKRALAIREKVQGAEHPDTATSLNALAGLLYSQGHYAAAKPLFERGLAISEKVLGADNPDTATSLNNLAALLDDQGDYEGAKPLYERALAIREKALGAEHPSTARYLNNLALLLFHQGDYAGAKLLCEQALAIFEKALGAGHPDTAASLNNLALVLESQGDYAAAKPHYERALTIKEKALGAEHPDTATSLNNLAELLRVQGNYAAAKPLYERALAIYEKVLGAEHPWTAANLNNLALLRYSQGEYAAATSLYERALAICEKVLGADHPNTKRVGENLERVRKLQK
ncbi:MAG TPA: tetratricopeptide repeat protein [Methylocella sp.]|nr:tetratricopeptide repeat protein [Methylocella sp.]